jgi:translocation and assembly module TamA
MSGLRLRLDLQGGVRQLFSSATFGRVVAEAKAIRSLGPRLRVIARAEAGRLFSGEGIFRTLPLTMRFFAGGDQSVRGYRFRGLGIEDVEGNVIGGPNLFTGTLEVDFRVFERWAVAAFTDVGGASDRFGGDLEQGVGAGIRWLSPIGLIRVDGAFPVSEPDLPFRIHIGLGPDL